MAKRRRKGGKRRRPNSAAKYAGPVVYITPEPPPTVRGVVENLCLYQYNPANPQPVSLVESSRQRQKAAKPKPAHGMEATNAWRAANGLLDADEERRVDSVRATLAAAKAVAGTAPPSAKVKKAAHTGIGDADDEQLFDWVSILPTKLGTTNTSRCNGSNLDLRAVKSCLQGIAKKGSMVPKVFDLLLRVRREGAAFDYAPLTAAHRTAAPQGSSAAASSAAAGPSRAAGPSSAAAGSSSCAAPDGPAQRAVVETEAEIQRLTKQLQALSTQADTHLQAMFHNSNTGDGEAHLHHQKEWHKCLQQHSASKKALIKLNRKRLQAANEAAKEAAKEAVSEALRRSTRPPPADARTLDASGSEGESDDSDFCLHPSSDSEDDLEYASETSGGSAGDSDLADDSDG